MEPLYNDYNAYLRRRFGCKVYRVGLDAGSTCPNRDGTKGYGGCVYCNEKGSRSPYTDPALTVREQLERGMRRLRQDKGAQKFIAYFQAFSNTYGPVSRLKELLDTAIAFPEIVGISVGTRPDTVDQKKMAVLASYTGRREVWVEYGLQTIHDRTLELLNRRHSYEDFVQAVRLTKQYGLLSCAHVILGLPGEDRDDMIKTAQALSALGINGVKIHLLHILKGSMLEVLYCEGKVSLLSQEEYVRCAADFLEYLSPEIVIQRLTGEGDPESHIAPEWARAKIETIERIKAELEHRVTRQGGALSGSSPAQ